MKRTLLTAAMLTLAFSAACAPATPTVDPASIQASAVAAASTMVAMTQAAVPTPTEIPPTPPPSPTLLPSPTLIALPTLDLGVPTLAPPAPAATSSTDLCNGPMPSKPAGLLTSAKLVNATNGSVVLSLNLQKTGYGECGYRSYNLTPHASMTAAGLPLGCYWAGAFVNDPKAKSKSFGAPLCMRSTGGKVIITVWPDVVKIGS
jgi:hypothetical protein